MKNSVRGAMVAAFAAPLMYLATGCGGAANEAGAGDTKGVAPLAPKSQAEYLKQSQDQLKKTAKPGKGVRGARRGNG